MPNAAIKCRSCGAATEGRFCSSCGLDKFDKGQLTNVLGDMSQPFRHTWFVAKSLFKSRQFAASVINNGITTADVMKFYIFTYAISAFSNSLNETSQTPSMVLNRAFQTNKFSWMDRPIVGEIFILLYALIFIGGLTFFTHLFLKRAESSVTLEMSFRVNAVYQGLHSAIKPFTILILSELWIEHPDKIAKFIQFVLIIPLIFTLSFLYDRSFPKTFGLVLVGGTFYTAILFVLMSIRF